MNVYCIALNKPTENKWKDLKTGSFANHHYTIGDHLAFVASGESTLIGEISKQFGMDDEKKVSGTVLRILPGNYYGFNEKGLWEWIDKELRETA